MNLRLIMTAVCLFGCGSLFAESKVLFKSDFEQDNPLKGFVCSRDTGITPPDAAFGMLGSETVDGKINHFYRGLSAPFGVSVILEHPYKVCDNTVTIEIKVRVRGNGDCNFCMIDLSSLESPKFPYQFSAGKSSGFGAGGYRHANTCNNIYYYKNTKKPVTFTDNTSPLPDNDWHEWKLVYNNVDSTLVLYLDNATTPLWIQKEVKLGGVEFNSLWLSGSQFGSDYDDIIVSVVEKDAAK